MKFEDIKEQLINALVYDAEIWGEVLDKSSPGNYGNNSWEVYIDEENFYVNVANRTFKFSGATFSGELIMGSSRGDYSYDLPFSKPSSGNGTFRFSDDVKSVIIEDCNVNCNMYLLV
jgi:hypothetical protein